MAFLSACDSTLMKPGNCSSTKTTRFRGRELNNLLVPLFAEPGSNKRELEERVSIYFTRYLEDVNDAKVKGNH